MLKDFRIGNPHALDYCLPANPPKALYTPPRERRTALQQALDAAGDAFTTGRSRMDWSVKSLPSGDFEVVRDRKPDEFRVGDRVVARVSCSRYDAGDHGVVVDIPAEFVGRILSVRFDRGCRGAIDGGLWSLCPNEAAHEGAAL